MKRGGIVLVIIAILLLFLIIFRLSFTGKAVFNPVVPTSCSDTAIKTSWDSIFYELSDGITIIVYNTSFFIDGQCAAYFAYKIAGDKVSVMMRWGEPAGPGGANGYSTLIYAWQGNFTQSYKNALINISNWSDINDKTPLQSDLNFFSTYVQQRASTLTAQDANTTLSSIFKDYPGNLVLDTLYGDQAYSYQNNFSNSSHSILTKGKISLNHTYSELSYGKESLTPSTSCIPSWTAHNTTCQANDRLVTYFTDSHSCNQNHENLTFHCDANNNGIIGNVSDLNSSDSLSLYINTTLANSSTNYTGRMNTLVEIKQDSNVIVEFLWNFSQPLDLDNMYIEKQSSSASRGYLLVKGIYTSKNVFVNRISSSTRICVKNSEASSIASLTENCTGAAEIYLNCPGTIGGISCYLSGGYFRIEGLTNSAVKEMQQFNCTPNWNCTNWTSCLNSSQSQNCTDLNSCNSSMLKKTSTRACVPPAPPCTPSWNCTNWTKCSKGNQTRVCTDKNNCRVNTGKPLTKQSCEVKSNFILIVIAAIVILLIAATLIAIIIILNKKPEVSESSPIVQYSYPPPRRF